jgi:hypothetical protein
MSITGFDRAQAQYENMEPPYEAECSCLKWRCWNCGVQYDAPGTCPDTDCNEQAGPATLAELDHSYLMESVGLAAVDCPAHGGCTCGDDRCRECN